MSGIEIDSPRTKACFSYILPIYIHPSFPTQSLGNIKSRMERHNHRLLIGTINISLERRALLEPLEAVQRRYNPDDQDSRYNKVRVAFGKRVEPWVIVVDKN